PVLSPQIVDLHHPFPHLINKNLYLVIKLKNEKKETLYGFLSVPSMIPRILTLPSASSLRYMIIEDLLFKFVDQAFSMYEVIDKSIIRVTRNADINPDDEQYDVDDDYRHHMKKVLKKRGRLRPVRLEIYGNISLQILDYICEKLNLKKSQVFKSKSPLDMKYAFSLGDKMPKLTRRSLSYEPFIPKTSPAIKPHESMIKQIIKHDILLFYPYEKMNNFLMLIKEAAIDPSVVSIKITIYRLASNSMLVDYLKLAVENKKEVIVLMELRARFDEESNIKWSDELEQAGCKIIYGFEGYKVHSKICLITRREKGKIQYITQIGTGNYNENTAKIYTDLCLMTSNNLIGKDAYIFFQNMAISNLSGEYEKLLVAPNGLKNKIINFIDDEISKGENGKIIMKMNSLTDREIIDKLSEASKAGVEIKLIIRGICCLLPGIDGKTENIKIISIVGRFLEHSRIYCFGRSLDNIKIYIGSADMMTRNTQKRVEILAPVLNKDIQKQILNILDVTEHDTIKARRIKPNGGLEKIPIGGAVAIDSQAYFMHLSNSYNISDNGKIKGFIKFLKDKFKLK
ncbi:MAG: polyphosphate kinase 1, partial [Oscillospiraceae bacterium]|nr:polyphosphate kinase 1 [Oscillospiraceae bacterium]